MRLISLKIKKLLDDSIIRDIKFNKFGLSLIVDKDSKEGESGNNLGKTTFVKLIDLVLGGSDSKIVYTGKDKSINNTLKNFIDCNQIYVELKLEKLNGESLFLRRDLFIKGKCYINGKECKNLGEYNIELKRIFFTGANDQDVSFRKLMPLFVRYDEGLNNIFKYLGNFTKDDQYISCYRELMFLSKRDDIQFKQIIKEKVAENKVILKNANVKNYDELEQKMQQKKAELDKLSTSMKSNEVVTGFLMEGIRAAQSRRIEELSSEVSTIELQISIFESKIENEKVSISPIDKEALTILYGEVSALMPLKVDFNQLVDFHKKMVYSRINHYEAKIDVLRRKFEEKKNELQTAKKEYADCFVEYKYSLNDVTNIYFEDVVELKSSIDSFKITMAKYVSNREIIEKLEESLRQISIQNDDDMRKKEIVRDFFEKTSNILLGNENDLNFMDVGFPIKLHAEDNGDGNTKILIACFSYALNHLYETLSLDRPSFLVEDAMENVSLKYLNNLIIFSREQKMQLVVPILYDRIQTLNTTDKDIVLYLSKNEKLFKI